MRIIEQVDDAAATFKSLTESLDTTGACGRLMMNMLGSFNQFERELIKERTNLGLKRARAAGRIGGGRFKLTPAQRKEAIRMVENGEKSQAEVAELFQVSEPTISRMMKEVRELRERRGDFAGRQERATSERDCREEGGMKRKIIALIVVGITLAECAREYNSQPYWMKKDYGELARDGDREGLLKKLEYGRNHQPGGEK